MYTDIYFLRTVSDAPQDVNVATALGYGDLFNFSHSFYNVTVDTNTDALVIQGSAFASADAIAEGSSDSDIFVDLVTVTDSEALIEDGASQVSAESHAEVVASFFIGQGETFSFDFNQLSDLASKEIENTDAEFARTESISGFMVFETSDAANPVLLGYFSSHAIVISSAMIAGVEIEAQTENSDGRIEFLADEAIDIDGNNGIDYASSLSAGFYEQTFQNASHITIIEFNSHLVELIADTLIGRLGDDVTYGTIWDDTLTRSGSIYGSMGNDRLSGQRGNDILEGGQGDDTLLGGGGDDSIFGALGDDSIKGGSGIDILIGGDGNDTLSGRGGNDHLDGGRGNDMLLGGTNRDSLIGGTGNDTISGDSGNDTALGGAGADLIFGNAGADSLDGGAGDDSLSGGAGKDTLVGGEGADTLAGGGGNDVYVIDDEADQVIEYDREGTDRVESSVSYELGKWLENLDLTGDEAIDGTGNKGANIIGGNEADNVLSGLGGHDSIDGRGGNDLLLGGAGNDSLAGGFGNDTLIGGAGGDTLRGGDGADLFWISVDFTDRFADREVIVDYTRTQGDLLFLEPGVFVVAAEIGGEGVLLKLSSGDFVQLDGVGAISDLMFA